MKPRMVAVLGLDALPYYQLGKIAEKGVAPNLINNSTVERAIALRAIPPLTPASWPSIMGGVNPGKHGIFSFFHWDREKKEARLVNSIMLEHPRIHEMLSYEGISSLVVNPIPDYPMIPARRAMILSNMFFTPRPLSSPRGLHEKYFSEVGWPPDKNPEEYERYMNGLIAMIEDILRDPPPLAWININFPDALYHHYPEFIDHPEKISRLWGLIDKLAVKLRDTYGNLLVVSDHGFRIYKARVNVNDILYRNGFLVPSKEETETSLVEEHMREKGIETRRIVLPGWFYDLLSRLRIEPIARKFYYNVLQKVLKKLLGKSIVVRAGKSVDFHNSIAYMPFGGAYGVYVEDQGIKDKVLEVLKSTKGLIVYERHEVYSGPYTHRGPDIVVIGDNQAGYALGPARVLGTVYTWTRFPHHDMWGTLIPFLEDDLLELDVLGREAPNYIVAPLVQCFMGVPVSAQADDLALVRRACRKDVVLKNYVGKFRISKRMVVAARKRPR